MKKLPAREQQILRATVHHYVDTTEPVSSKTLVQRFNLNTSSATVRSAMGSLEQRGLLNQPHKSAGRVPTAQGYRHYVNCLLPPPGSSVQHLEKELTNLSFERVALDDLLSQVARRLTDFTGLMSLITRPRKQIPKLKEVRLVESCDRLLVMLVDSSNQASLLNLRLPHQTGKEIKAIETWICNQLMQTGDGQLNWTNVPPQLNVSGALLKEAIEKHTFGQISHAPEALFHGVSSLLSQPEFTNSKSISPLLDLIDEQPTAVLTTNQLDGIWIGSEHPQKALRNCSVVQSSYRNSGNDIGYVALIGPMRMAYSTAKAAVATVALHLNRVLS